MSNILSRFTPSVMTREALESTFVQREKLVSRVLELIEDSVLTRSKHYTLLVGPRGIGKTHLVSLINYRAKAANEVNGRIVIAWLREEEWGVTTLLDLLLRIFQALLSENHDSNLEGRVEALYLLTQEDAERSAALLLKDFVGDRTLLIILENLDDLFGGLGDAGQKRLRSFLQENPFCTIVATSQSLFSGISLRSSPFYGFFRIRHLEDLTLTEATNLLVKIAEFVGDTDLASFIKTPVGRARVRAVHHLAGGNHRVYVIFSQFLTRESLNDLVEPVVNTLDDLTPYYQARMAWLSPQQRKIIEFLVRAHRAVTVGDIAQRCFMTHQTASSQLKTLKDMGYVQSVAAGRHSFYEVREPLMRLCMEIKQHRAEPLRLFIDFVRLWYSHSELEHQLSMLQPEDRIDREYMVHALRVLETEEDPRLSACRKDCDSYLMQGDFDLAFQAAEELVAIRGNQEDWNDLGHCLLHLGKWKQGLESYDKVVELNPTDSDAWGQRGWALMELGQLDEAISSLDKAIEIDPTDAMSWYNKGGILVKLTRYEDALASYNRAINLESKLALLWAAKGWVLLRLLRHDEALEAYDRALQFDSKDPHLWHSQADVFQSLGRFEKALESNEKALELNSSFLWGWIGKGYALAAMARFDEALPCFDAAIEIDNSRASTWRGRGAALDDLGRHEEALVSFESAIKLDPNNAIVWYDKGLALQRLKRYEEALSSYDRSLVLKKDTKTMRNRGLALLSLGKPEEALLAFSEVVELAPTDPRGWLNRANALERVGRLEEAQDDYRKATDLEPKNPEPVARYGAILGNLKRYEEALQYFDRAIALGHEDPSSFFNRAEALLALERWDESALSLEQALERFPYQKTNFAGDTAALIRIVLSSNLDRPTLEQRVANIVRIFEKYSALVPLAQALVQNIATLRTVDVGLVRWWYELWQRVAVNFREFTIPLRLLKTAAIYLETNDSRVMLELPVEEREIVAPLLSRN